MLFVVVRVRGGEEHAATQAAVGVFDVEMVRHVSGVGDSCEVQDLEAMIGLSERRVLVLEMAPSNCATLDPSALQHPGRR